MKEEEEHRGTIESVAELFTSNGFVINKKVEESFEMKFLNGTAFLNHHFVKLGWLPGWLKLFPENLHQAIFGALERNLNFRSDELGCLKLQVPMAFVQGVKN